MLICSNDVCPRPSQATKHLWVSPPGHWFLHPKNQADSCAGGYQVPRLKAAALMLEYGVITFFDVPQKNITRFHGKHWPSPSKTTINWWQKRHASSSAPRKSAHWTLGCPHAAWSAVEGAKLLHVTHLSHLPTCRNPQESRKKNKEYPQPPKNKNSFQTRNEWSMFIAPLFLL